MGRRCVKTCEPGYRPWARFRICAGGAWMLVLQESFFLLAAFLILFNVPNGVVWNNSGIFSMHNSSKLLAAVLCAASSIVYATDESSGEIVVTATRLDQPLKQSLSSTTVITAQDIRNSQAPDVATILRCVAGVEIDQNGGTGKTAG